MCSVMQCFYASLKAGICFLPWCRTRHTEVSQLQHGQARSARHQFEVHIHKSPDPFNTGRKRCLMSVYALRLFTNNFAAPSSRQTP